MSSMEAFERAYGVTPEEPKDESPVDESVSSVSAFDRALEADAVDVRNTPELPDEGSDFFDKVFAEPYQRAVQRQAEVFSRAAGQGQPSMGQQMADPAALAQAYQRNTNLGSVLLQTVANPISMFVDGASSALVIGAEGAFELLPEEGQEWAMDKIKAVLDTKMGQYAMNAAGQGAEAWSEFEETYPNEAANFLSAFDLTAGLTKALPTKVKPELKPMKVERVGMRKEFQPLKGQDKDLYNIAFDTPNKPKTQTQVENTTDPQGILGVQEQLATPEQLEVVDLLKEAKITGQQTKQGNFNSLKTHMDKMDDSLMKLAGRSKTDWPTIDNNVRVRFKENMNQMIQENTQAFSSKASRETAGRLFQDFLTILDEQGGTAQGLIVARRMMDDKMNRMGIDLSGDKLNANFLTGTALRKAVNDTIFESVPEAQQIFEKTSKLIPVYETLQRKASTEARTSFGRLVQNLGITNLQGETGRSIVVNAAYTLGALVAGSPVYAIKQQLKRAGPAKGRAAVGYAVADIKREIAKALKRNKDPAMKAALMQDARAAYVALDAAGKTVAEEMEEQKDVE